ncbi:MAG: hypothetical protein ACUVTL_06240 [Thermoproteota archaeon]
MLNSVVEVNDFYVVAGSKDRNYHGKLCEPPSLRGLKPPPGRGSY